jgi:hypothetical protein
MRGFSVGLVASLFLVGPVLAASPVGELKDIDGTVYVNRGKGFEPARGTTELFQGDRVMVGEKGSATVSYHIAQCEVMLGAVSMTTITEEAPCKDGVVIAPAADVVLPPEVGGPPPILWLGLTTVLVCGLVHCFDDDDDGQSP